MLVIADSINRDNMQLYGYGRATTPRLLDMQRRHPEEMLVLRHAWSADASTLPSLNNLFGFGEPDAAQAQHLIAMARTAGYKVWWMSNHDDIAVEQQHARLANVVDMVNRTSAAPAPRWTANCWTAFRKRWQTPPSASSSSCTCWGPPALPPALPKGENPSTMKWTAWRRKWSPSSDQPWCAAIGKEYDGAAVPRLRGGGIPARDAAGRKGAERRAWVYPVGPWPEVGHGENRAGHSPGTERATAFPPSSGPTTAARPRLPMWRSAPSAPTGRGGR